MESDSLTFFVAGVAAGAIGGAVSLAAVESYFRWYRRPRLVIGEDRPEHGEHFTCNAIVIANRGRSVAKNCMGTITLEALDVRELIATPEELIQAEDIGMDPTKFNVRGKSTLLMSQQSNRLPVENELLAWARIGNPVAIDLPPSVGAMLDVARYVRPEGSEAQLHIPSEKGWSSILVALRPGTYKLRLKVHADNAASRERAFTLQCENKSVLVGTPQ